MSKTSDRVSEENSKKTYERTKEHSNKFELNNEYTEIIDNIGKSHETFSDSHKDEILRMAKILDQVGDTKKENICSKVAKDLEESGIKKRYVQKILPDEYKRDYDKQMRPRALSEMIGNDPAQKKPIEVTNNGQTTTGEEENENRNPLDKIYSGKSLEQMRKEAQKELQEDKEGTLENPANMLKETPNPAKESVVANNNNPTPTPIPVPLLSDKSPEFREMEVRLIETNQALEEKDKIVAQREKETFLLRRQLAQTKSGSLSEENQRLKVENSNLRTLLSDVDKESLEKEGLKEIEVLKMESGTTRMLNEVSSKSQRTFFLIVHPKTMQIKGAKTDVQMHQIQAKRDAGLI